MTWPEPDDNEDDEDWEWGKKDQRCEICGEPVKPGQEAAEMFDPDPQAPPWKPSVICHAQCGLNKGMDIA